VNHNTRHQRVYANIDDAGTPFELTLQRYESGLAPLPSWDFDTNTVRRLVDDNRAGCCDQRYFSRSGRI
jgi:hypothetical protein